ncbi:hypothetical protein N7526_001670 [Penicillium atrosanguineum]|nr:hypothetical protein N7526_001670 [Penicillium atrosanguineum]
MIPELDATVKKEFGITTTILSLTALGALALPNILDKGNALKEIAYAYDGLKADGIILFTRYGEGNHYLGHPDFQDIWAELNRRPAVILVHPTHPVDTAQTAFDILYLKTVRNNPNSKIILSHTGGTFPFLIGRPASILPKNLEDLDVLWNDARNFYYDTAVAGTENVFRILERFAKPYYF